MKISWALATSAMWAASVTACSPHGAGEEPVPEVEPPPTVVASIASAQMIEDCPDRPGADHAADVEAVQPAAPARMAAKQAMPAPGALAAEAVAGDAPYPDFVMPCEQSTMVMQFDGGPLAGAGVAVKSVRVVDADTGFVLGMVTPRNPRLWVPEGRYDTWDGRLPGHDPAKVLFDISVPDWTAVDMKLAEVDRERRAGTKAGPAAAPSAIEHSPPSSWGRMLVLEADVEIEGREQQARSPEFVRRQPAQIVT